MKKILKNQRAVTMLSLVITVIILGILGNTVAYKALSAIQLSKVEELQTDIGILRDKVTNYYALYGDFPANKSYEYTNISGLGDILGANDIGKFYVLDLSMLENLTLKYGEDFQKYKEIIVSGVSESEKTSKVNEFLDIYIINETSLNIFYAKGLELDDNTYYTDYSSKNKDTIKVKQNCLLKIKTEETSLTVNVNMTNVKNTEILGYQFKLLNEDDSIYQDWTSSQTSSKYIYSDLEEGKKYKVFAKAIIEINEEIDALNNGILINI